MKYRESEYTFASTLVRSNETHLLRKRDFERVLEAKDRSGILNILKEFGYSEGKNGEVDFSELLNEEEKKLYKMIFSAIPYEEVLNFNLLFKDYHNIKVLVKGEALGFDNDHLLMDFGLIPKEKIKSYIRERNFIFLEPIMKEGTILALESYGKDRDPQMIDVILDKACYLHIMEKVLETENPFIIEYLKLSIDLINVSSFLRLREIQKDKNFFKKVFIEGGNIEISVFLSGYEDEISSFSDKLYSHNLKDFVLNSWAELERGKGYFFMEKAIHEMKIQYLRAAKYITIGVEPILAYMVAKEGEIQNLRMVLESKTQGVDSQVILERLRETYV